MGRIVSLGERRRLKALENAAKEAAAGAITSNTGVILRAAQLEDTHCLTVGEQNPGIKAEDPGFKILRGHPLHGLLKAAFEDSVQSWLLRQMSLPESDDIPNKRWFWTFPDRPGRARFVTPAHLCRSTEMAAAINRKRISFQHPDAEGHQPLYFIARYALDEGVIPHIVFNFNANANYSGHQPGNRYEAPVFQAIHAGNACAVKGFTSLPKSRCDLNIRGLGGTMTPLMFAIEKAEEALTADTDDIFARLDIVTSLAACHSVDIFIKDPFDSLAEDKIFSDAVRQAYEQGLDAREQAYQQMREHLLRRAP